MKTNVLLVFLISLLLGWLWVLYNQGPNPKICHKPAQNIAIVLNYYDTINVSACYYSEAYDMKTNKKYLLYCEHFNDTLHYTRGICIDNVKLKVCIIRD